jgi:uncharacterized protein (DUF305 family)
MSDHDPVATPRDAALSHPHRTRPTAALNGVVLAAVAVIAAYIAGGAVAADVPGDDSPEAGFARDMSAHHAQAVQMAELLRPKTDDPEMQLLASDIALTQQAQIGQMNAWLDVWGLPAYSDADPMAWMGMAHDSVGDMPGMASRAAIAELARQQGETAEQTFLQLMIEHHRSGVTMAEAALQRSDEPVVRNLAERIVASQQSEIDTMEALLDSGSAAEGEDDDMPDDDMTEHDMSGADDER